MAHELDESGASNKGKTASTVAAPSQVLTVVSNGDATPKSTTLATIMTYPPPLISPKLYDQNKGH